MNDEWKGIKVRSVVHPRDGGVNNPSTRGRYRTDTTDIESTFRKERARIKATERAAQDVEPVPPAVLSLLARVTT